MRELRGHVVSHTHWDRAWYWTVEQTRVRLLDMMDDLLELLRRDPTFEHFVLDGQMAMVEDYLALRPERREEIAELSRAGRLLLGPFYVLPDLHIPSGESLVRNLQRGVRLAAALGPVMRFGYLPDSFGHPAQLPQILAGFGIDGMLLARGVGDEGETLGADFWWEAPDGSRVLATHQIGGGYCNLARLGRRDDGTVDEELAAETVARVAAAVLAGSPHGQLLLNNGCDHLPAQPELPALLRALSRRGLTVEGRRLRLEHSTPVAYQRAVRRAIRSGRFRPGTYRGELRGSRYANILSGTLSARTDLKLRHDAVETLLLRWAEPWSALARAFAGGRDDRPLIDRAWELLLQCQPHDDICGCSIDQVHHEDLARLELAKQIALEVRDRALSAVLHQRGQLPDVVFNPHPWPCRSVVSNKAYVLPPLGTLVIGDSTPDAVRPARARLRGRTVHLENSELSAQLDHRGRITVRHPRSGLQYVAELVDEGDAGDAYDFCPPARQRVVRNLAGRSTLSADGIGAAVGASLYGAMLLPVGLRPHRRARSRTRVAHKLALHLALDPEIPYLTIKLKVFWNDVESHRLRLAVRAPFVVDTFVAGGPFQLLRRPVLVASRPDWQQPPSPTQPFQDYVALDGPAGGIAVVAPGLREVEARRVDQGIELLLTLLRQVSDLSRDDLSSRRGHAGPATPVMWATDLDLEVALLPFAGRAADANIPRWAAEHAAPCEAARVTDSSLKSEPPDDLPARQSFLSLEPPCVQLTSLAPGPDRALDARLVNLEERPVTARIVGPYERRARRLRLDGTPLRGSVRLDEIPLRPCEILTLRLIPRP